MQSILNFVKFCWRVLNFIRDVVMNLVFLLFVVLGLGLLSLVTSFQGKPVAQDLSGDQGALWVNLDGYLRDNRENPMSWNSALKELNNQHVPRQISTFDVGYAIASAAEDVRIKGLALDLNYFEGGDLPALEYVGKAIQLFKTSGKPVIAYADNYTQEQYFLASYADEIYLNTQGSVGIEGMAVDQLYFKSLLDKFAITPHIFRVGTYKSAVEPFLRDDMSAEAKSNLQQWLGKMWHNYQQQIADNRQIPLDSVLPKASQYLQDLKALQGDSTAYAKQRKLVTQTADRFTLDQKLTALFGKNSDGSAKLLPFDDYLANLPDRMQSDSANKIAVVNVEGAIIDGESDKEDVGGDTIAALLRQAYDDPQIKAVILRVNSPGGSAFASELIRQEVSHLQQGGKPVIVSMGGMAASGGYWISSTADYIVADKNTITGSIGIFAMVPTFENTIKKAGVSEDGVATTDLVTRSPFTPISAVNSEIIQLEIEKGYDRFLDVVSQGRKISKAEVDNIAQGQVWLGEDAYQRKLVDAIGDFDVAVEKAIELINKGRPAEEPLQDIGVEWLVDEDNSVISTLLRDLKQSQQSWIKNAVLEWTGFPKQAQQLQQQLGKLNQLNDPKGQYLYCLNCASVK
ncbi:protease 4 [[Pasteurella] aerogenes]|nr:protease 4 [[Pasteurella] aerogenes]